MPSGVFKYSASYAKTKAMRRKLLSGADYDALLLKTTVDDIASYLKNNTHYGGVIPDISDGIIHRGKLETVLHKAKESEFSSIFRFEAGNNKRFLLFAVLRYETELIKEMLRLQKSGILFTFDTQIDSYYQKHMTINTGKLTSSTSLSQFIANLKGSPYYKILLPLAAGGEQLSIFHAEMTLDTHYFTAVWSMVEKLLAKKDRLLVGETFGSETDMLNILWIYRCKKYFDMPKELIYSFLIAKGYRLRRKELVALVESKGLDEFFSLVKKTPYKKLAEKKDVFIEQYYFEFVANMYHKLARLAPFSIISALAYMHEKEAEVGNLVKIIEGIRYNLDMVEIKNYLIRKHGDA